MKLIVQEGEGGTHVPLIMWMDEILHHRRTPWNKDPLQIPTINGVPWFLRWCRISSIHSSFSNPPPSLGCTKNSCLRPCHRTRCCSWSLAVLAQGRWHKSSRTAPPRTCRSEGSDGLRCGLSRTREQSPGGAPACLCWRLSCPIRGRTRPNWRPGLSAAC